MCLGFMSFRAPPAALKQKNYHKSPNMSPIITQFQVLFKFIKRHLLTIVSKELNVFFLCYIHSSFFVYFIFNKFPATCAFHMCVEYDKTKQTPSNKIWYDMYIRQILYKNTCVYVPFWCEKTRVSIIASLTLKVPRGGAPYMVSIGQVFHYTVKTCLFAGFHQFSRSTVTGIWKRHSMSA